MLLGPARHDFLRLIARHPNDYGLCAGRSCLVANGVRRFDVARHPRFQHLAPAIDHVLEFSRNHVENLDRAVLMVAGIQVRGKDDLADGNSGADVALVEHEPERRPACRSVRDALRLVRRSRRAHEKAQSSEPADDEGTPPRSWIHD